MLTNASGRQRASDMSSDRMKWAAQKSSSATSMAAMPPSPSPLAAAPPAATPTSPDVGADGADGARMGRPRDAEGEDAAGRPATIGAMADLKRPWAEAVS